MTTPRWSAVLLAVLVTVFAFLAASVAAGNSDFWLHLATGRLLAHGDYQFGVDPFSYTTHGVYWANHAWLSDLCLYVVHNWLGGATVVVLKACLVAGLALVMLRLAQPQSWIAPGCVLLGLLAMSPRFLVQPALLSLLLLAVCLAVLRAGGRCLVALPVLVALWVNLDSWFLLGPLVVALYGLGQLLTPGQPRLPVWLLAACVAACLLSPHHVHALTLPPELSPAVWLSDFRDTPTLQPLFASLWKAPEGGFPLTTWAFFLLLALGGISFALERAALRDWRLPIWLTFAVLATWQLRLVGFFAVVAGPIAALNWQGVSEKLTWRFRIMPRLLVAGTALVLMALAWPSVRWEVRSDSSLQRLAETLGRWRSEGMLSPQERSFAFHPDVAHYCAWFAPAEKTFVDTRLQLFLGVAADYRQVCQALLPPADSRERSASRHGDWEGELRRQGVACLVLYDPNFGRLSAALQLVTEEGTNWQIVGLPGQAVLARWHETSNLPLFDPEATAFRAEPDDVFPPAPARGPTELARPLFWWERWVARPSGTSWQTGTAAVCLRLFEVSQPQQLERQERHVLARFAAGLAGFPNPWSGGAARLVLSPLFVPDLREQSSALPLLAVRLARTGVSSRPDDYAAWLVLAQAWRYLDTVTAETPPDAFLPLLHEIRFIQIVNALEQVVALRPNLAAAREMLARLYSEQGFLDLALRHRLAELHLLRRAGNRESTSALRQRLELLEKAVASLSEQVQTSENRFVVRTHALAADPLARARIALDLGLAGKACDEVLLRSNPDLYGLDGLRLLVQLLLQTGRAQEAAQLLDREEIRTRPESLGYIDLVGSRPNLRWSYRLAAHDWFDLCQAAALGHYARAEIALDRLDKRLEYERRLTSSYLTRQLVERLTTELGVGTAPAPLALRLAAQMGREQMSRAIVRSQTLPVERADLKVVAAFLLLERGFLVQARELLERAQTLYDGAAATVPALPGQPLTLRTLTRLKPPRTGTP